MRIKLFEQFVNEAKSVVTIQSFLDELGSWPEHIKKLTVGKLSKMNIDTKNNGAFRNIIEEWKAGTYDNDMEVLVQEVNALQDESSFKTLKDLIEFIDSRDSQKWRINKLLRRGIEETQITGNALDKLVKSYLKINMENTLEHGNLFFNFMKSLKETLAKESKLEKTNKYRLWKMDKYSDGNSSVAFTSNEQTIGEIKKEIPKLEKELAQAFPKDKAYTNKKFIDQVFDEKADITGAVGISFYPNGWVTGDFDGAQKVTDHVREWALNLAKKYKMTEDDE